MKNGRGKEIKGYAFHFLSNLANCFRKNEMSNNFFIHPVALGVIRKRQMVRLNFREVFIC